MRFESHTGYAFEVSVNVFPEVATDTDQCALGIIARSPRSAFFVMPRAVERYAVEDFIVHLRAMLDGLVEVSDPDSDEGFAEFPALLLKTRQLPPPDGSVTFELSFHDCGCDDDAPFNHASFIEVTITREALARNLDALEAEVWTENVVGSSG